MLCLVVEEIHFIHVKKEDRWRDRKAAKSPIGSGEKGFVDDDDIDVRKKRVGVHDW